MNWFNIIAGTASLLGLWFSIWAWVRAKSASKAAEEARKAVTVRTLAEEFQLACANVDQLLDFLTYDRLPEASLRARDLAFSLSEIPSRRSPYLSSERLAELSNVKEIARMISEELASGQQAPQLAEQKQRLIRQCQKISITLRENLGTIKGEIDRGAKQ